MTRGLDRCPRSGLHQTGSARPGAIGYLEDERVARQTEAPRGTRARGDPARRSLQLNRRDVRAQRGANRSRPQRRAQAAERRAPARPRARRPEPRRPSRPPTSSCRAPGRRSRPRCTRLVRDLQRRRTRTSRSTTRPSARAAASRRITEQTVDFGASDAAMKDEEIAALAGRVRSSTCRPRSAPSWSSTTCRTSTAINLDADTIAGIFLGTITNWNDPKIAALNLAARPCPTSDHGRPSLRRLGHDQRLHDLPRHRQPRLAHQRRRGQGGPVADGQRRPGQRRRRRRRQADRRRGRLRRAQVRDAGQPRRRALVKNAAGKFVAGAPTASPPPPRPPSANFPADFRQAPIINGAGDTTYPIASYTYLLVYRRPDGREQGQAMVVVPLLGPDRRPGRGEDPRLRAAAGRDPAEGHRRAPQGHHRGQRRSGPSPSVLSSSADRPHRSGRGRSARSIARRHRTSGRQ